MHSNEISVDFRTSILNRQSRASSSKIFTYKELKAIKDVLMFRVKVRSNPLTGEVLSLILVAWMDILSNLRFHG